MAMARRAAASIGSRGRLCGLEHSQKQIGVPELWSMDMVVGKPWNQQGIEKNRRGLNMVLLGRPGCGKGTYGSRLSKLLKVPHISTGDLIRQELSKEGSCGGIKLSEVMNTGKLLPDDKVLKLLSRRLQEGKSRGEEGFILDGFPRTVKQTEILENVAQVDMAIKFKLDRQSVIKKCLGRRVCGECGQIFSLADVNVGNLRMPAILPPQGCVSKMVHRKDDTEESIQRRLQVYELESKPVEDFYRSKNKLVEFDVCGNVEANWSRLLEALKLDDDLVQHVKGSNSGRFWAEMGISACPNRTTEIQS